MVKIKPLDVIVDKWQRRASAAAEDLRMGIETTEKSWSAEAAKAEPSWATGVQQAIARKAFSSGVRRAGDTKWKRKALEVGVARYGPGVSAAVEDMKAGFAPYHEVIARISLPARGPRGDPKNYDRVKKLGDALHKRRVGGGAGGGK